MNQRQEAKKMNQEEKSMNRKNDYGRDAEMAERSEMIEKMRHDEYGWEAAKIYLLDDIDDDRAVLASESRTYMDILRDEDRAVRASEYRWAAEDRAVLAEMQLKK